MRFTERQQRYGVISRIEREGSVLTGALFYLGGRDGERLGKGLLWRRVLVYRAWGISDFDSGVFSPESSLEILAGEVFKLSV